MNQLQVRVRRKGQITIPKVLRLKLGIDEGTILDVAIRDGSVMLKPLPRLEPGEPVGEEEYRRIIEELDRSRRNWR